MKLSRVKLWLRRRLRLPTWLREVGVASLVAYIGCYLTTLTPQPLSLLPGVCHVIDLATLHKLNACEVKQLPGSGELGERLDQKVMDLWFSLRGRGAPPKDVLVIAVDEQSHSKLNVSSLAPWPRVLTAELLEKLAKFKPKAVVLDFSYNEKLDPNIDQRLADAIKLSPTYIARLEKKVEQATPTGELIEKNEVIKPLEAFTKSAAGTFWPTLADNNGVVRQFLMEPSSNPPTPALAPIVLKYELSKKPIPSSLDYINYYGPAGSIPSASFHEVLSGSDEFLSSIITSKYVLLGQKLRISYRAQQTDTFIIPYTGATSGVEIHATILANLLDGTWLKSPSFIWQMFGVFAITFCLVYTLFYASPFGGISIVLGAMLSWIAVSYVGFLFGFFIPGAFVVFGVLPVTYALLSLRAQLKAKALERAMGVSR